jgi:hypothetical protein
MVMKMVVVCGVMALLCSSCSTAVVKPPPSPTASPAFVAWEQSGPPEKRVCVLPFADQTGTAGLAAQVRQSFAGRLSVKRYVDAELHEIDSRLSRVGDWQAQSAQHLGKVLECDALVYGEVTQAGRWYLGIYSRVFLAGGIRMVDTNTGHIIVHYTYTTQFHGGGVPLSPLGVVANSVLNLRNMSDTQMVRVMDDLAQNLTDAVPDL